MNQVPKHIGFIMDGNRRWAKERGLTTKDGHEAGVNALSGLVEACAKRGVETVTVYALSTENLKKRSAKELADIFGILFNWMRRERKRLQNDGVKVAFLGQLKRLPQKVQTAMTELMDTVKHNERVKCNIMVGYGGRLEIIKAVQEIVKEGIPANEINEELISRHLYTKDSPDPDLIIRTGGDKRISNFLIWQMSYAELYFTKTYWPDFNEAELDKALEDYAGRARRYGGQDVALKST
jgi:undecaprenyl diphosphate synthase